MNLLSYNEFVNSKFYVAIYCQKVLHRNREFTTHSGLLLKIRGKQIANIHFATHLTLLNEPIPPAAPPNPCYCIGITEYDSVTDPSYINTRSFTNLILAVVNSNQPGFPYGLNCSPDTTFNSADQLLPGTDSIGLTCSTFLMTFFKKYAKALIDERSWEPRPEEDELWKKSILQMMYSKIDFEHFYKMCKEVVLYRFKPEEVVSAGHNYPVMSDFTFCKENGASLKNKLAVIE